MDANPGLIQTNREARDSPGLDDRHEVELAGVALACCPCSGHLPIERPHRGRRLTRAFLFFLAGLARFWALRPVRGRRCWACARRWRWHFQQLAGRRCDSWRPRGRLDAPREYRLPFRRLVSARGRPNFRCRSRRRSPRLSHPRRHRSTGPWNFRKPKMTVRPMA